MSAQPPSSVEHECARRYDQEHARVCLQPHPRGLVQRFLQWRGKRLVRRALKVAGEPGLILDVACGAGGNWPVLAEHTNRVILATDPSQEMLDHAQTHHPAELLKRVKTFQSSAFTIGLPENSVDCIFCMPLFQHIENSEDRLAMLREFHRVSRDALIVSVQRDGYFKLRARFGEDAQAHQLATKAELEAEFRQAGFKTLKYLDTLPGSDLPRVYVLHKAD
ncbi:SAM-dependent methyltransferase [Pseudomonas sp. GW460-R15]|uniref:class I SAM-dependent methyltransferase n=1 Tax=unclassified Pseudomonas TaxID=196821 RepID=UPI000CD2840D|nr:MULTISPECIES: class I SAM-dependent methyltransferase [unclassified Pseudomonas]POA65544.1 SAM-dependent methyltransferase [Pseudomonas sp. GW460-R15]